MKNINIYLSARDVDPKYADSIRALAQALVRNDFRVVFGGSATGLMKVLADTVLEEGGEIIGVSQESLADVCNKDLTETYIEKDLVTRKKKMIDLSDAFVLAPGGTGSFDEITDVIEMNKPQNGLSAPICIYNPHGFYDHLKQQFAHMAQEEFIDSQMLEVISFVDTPEELIEALKTSFTK